MAEDIARLGFEVDTSGIQRGEVALKRLSDAGQQIDKSFKNSGGAVKATGEALSGVGRRADESKKSFSGFVGETKKMVKSAGDMSTAAKKLSSDLDGAVGGLSKLTEQTKKTAVASNELGLAARRLGAAIGSAFALGKTISTITSFEDSILRLQATSNASAESMAKLEQQARLLGATSRYSAGQAADAQNFLAMAGLKTNEILSATPSVMKFASAASLDLARSADIASNVLGGMQLPVSQLDRVMNAMVSTAQSSNTNINQLGEAFAYAAPLAVTAAISVEELAAATGVLGDAGIQGGRAGTGLVGVIRQLSNVSTDGAKALESYGIGLADVDIKSRGIANVLETLRGANLSTADAMRIFGSESAAAALILSANVDKVKELTAANENAKGKLDEVASILDSSVSAAFAGVTSAIEEMMLRTGDGGLSGAMKLLAVSTAGVINSFNGMLPEFAKANGLSAEFERNIRGATTVLKIAGTAVAAYGVAVMVAGVKTKAAAAINALYSLSLTTVSTEATRATKAVATLQKAIALVAAAAAGWNIGEYLRNEFEIVEKAGIALAGGLHSTAVKIKGWFDVLAEDMKFALTNPLDFAMGKIADFIEWLAGLGAGTLNFFGIDTAAMEANIKAAGEKIRGVTAFEHKATINAIKENTRKELDTIAEGYADLFNQVGKHSKTAAKDVEEVAVVTKLLDDALNDVTNTTEVATKASKEAAKVLKDLEAERRKALETAIKEADALKQGNDALRDEIQQIGKTKRELVQLEQQRNRATMAVLDEKAATLELIAGREDEAAAIREQIKALDERNRLLGEKIDTEEVYESQKRIADAWQSISDDMGKTFTDAIIQGGANAKEAIKRMFQNMVLRPIIEPIMQGVSGMLTGVLGGGQSGGIMGMLSSAMGGGSGGGMGGMLQTGQSLYSAFTGWGKAMYTGFAEGGFTGAMQGLGSYVSNAFSGLTAKIGSIFGGTSAGGAGTGFGLGQSLVSGSAGNASFAGGSSGLGGMATAWPLAVVAGMIMSGKLYDQGVRPSASEMWASTQGNKIGQIGNVAATFQSGKFKLIDSVLEPIFGGKIASMLSGSTFHQALWGGINKKLFGGAWKTKDVGIGLGYDSGEFLGLEYEYRKKKGGLLAKGKKKTIWTALDEEIHDALSETMSEMTVSTKGLFEALGFEIADNALAGLKTGITQISTMGKTDEEIQEALNDWFADVNEQVVTELHKALGTGLDMDSAGLQEFVGNLLAVNSILDSLGLNAYDASIAGAELAQTLSGLTGGLEGLVASTDVYYKNFFTAEEQFNDSFNAMTKALDDAGLGAIESREAYREMVEGLDLTTEASQEMFATMMGLAGVASEYFSVLEAQAAEVAAYALEIDAMREALAIEPVLAYATMLEALQADFDAMAKNLESVGLATTENLDTLEAFRQKMAELAALDLFEGGQGMADALRQGLMGTWDGEAIGDYLARSISDGVYGAIAGQFANQITEILLQGVVAPMINAALTGASISEAVSSSTISSMVAQAQAVAAAAGEVMAALNESGVMAELQSALGGFKLPSVSYSMPAYRAPTVSGPSVQKVDDSWKNLLESIISQTKRAQQQIADMGRTTYEKGLAGIEASVLDFQEQIAQATASRRRQLTAELAKMEAAERELLELQMDQQASSILGGIADQLERMGKTDAELALMDIDRQMSDYIESLRDVGRATTENIGQVEAWAEAMREAAEKDARLNAASAAYDALSRAVDAQRGVITEALELARSVADAAGGAARSLFEDVLGAASGGAEQAKRFIADAVQTARATGYLPEAEGLREAIDAATRSFDDAAAVSVVDAQWQKLVLANQLKELADLAEPQVDYAQQQLDALDAALNAAREQIDLLQGIDTSVLSVADALERFNAAAGGGIQLPEVRTVDLPPAGIYEPPVRDEMDSSLLAEVVELRRAIVELQRDTKRTADAVNGRGDAPIIVEVV